MSGDISDAKGSSRVSGLVAALRSPKADVAGGASIHRSENLESVLPQGHRARLIWDYALACMGKDVLSGTTSEGSAASVPSPVLVAVWVYAISKKIGGVKDIVELCRVHPGFRWLCAETAVDEKKLLAFRSQANSDDTLARCLAGLTESGALGKVRQQRIEKSDERLLACFEECRALIQSLRLQLDAPISDVLKRRLVAVPEQKKRRQERVSAALESFDRLTDLQISIQRKLRDQQKQEMAKAVPPPLPPLPVIVRPVLGDEPKLPWSITRDESGRYRGALLVALLVFLVISSVASFYSPPPIERAEAEKLSPRLATLVLERRELPKPPPVKVEEVIKPKEQKVEEPIEKAPEKLASEPRREVVSGKPTKEVVAAAREKASQTGLVAMRSQLAALRGLSASSSLQQEQGSVGAEGSAQRVERDLIGMVATSGSGGVATGAVAYAGGGSLAGHKTTQVQSKAGAPTLAEIKKETKGGKRSNEDIKLGFDTNKSALYAIYRRALRENPALEGRVVLKLTIDAFGQVTACSVASSALKDPALEEKLISRVQLINFGARSGVESWTGTYHVDFVPSS